MIDGVNSAISSAIDNDAFSAFILGLGGIHGSPAYKLIYGVCRLHRLATMVRLGRRNLDSVVVVFVRCQSGWEAICINYLLPVLIYAW